MCENFPMWEYLLPSCMRSPKRQLVLVPEKKKAVTNQPSFQRVSYSDMRKPTSSAPLSPEELSTSLSSSKLHVFTLAELRQITVGFSSSSFLGGGGFGPVHKGFIDEKVRPGLKAQPVAVKLLDLEGNQGHREWLAEVIFLGQLRHPNLVKLIGYCYEDEHRLLVYEYMSRGSLENHLFKKYPVSLPWLTRLKIALGAAQGLAFLHGADKPVIYRDFKSANILLDSNYTAKLSDFGLAKDGPEGEDTHVSTRVMGTHGYAAPEYILTGHLTAKSDVYSFGVVLLELLTGRRSMDKTRPSREQSLVDWARSSLKNARRLSRIMDSRLEGQYSTKGALKAAEVAYQCLRHNPKFRPLMSAVVETLEPLLDCKDDIPTAYFVYTVAPEREKEKEIKEGTDRQGQQRRRSAGRRVQQPVRHTKPPEEKTMFSFTDTELYKNGHTTVNGARPHRSRGA